MGKDTLEIAGCDLVVERLGEGAPLVVFHGEAGTSALSPLLEKLGEIFDVHVPRLPGWPETRRAPHVRTTRDLALVAQEYIEQFDQPVAALGVSFGGWVALEVASNAPKLVSALALISPLGVKIGGREDRDFNDFYLLPEPARNAVFYAPENAPGVNLEANADVYLEKAIADDAFVRFGWQPFMHDPTLPARLRRVKASTLILSGDQDGFVLNPAYYNNYAKLIAGARHEVVAGGGHRLEEELPDAVAARVVNFVAGTSQTADRRSHATA